MQRWESRFLFINEALFKLPSRPLYSYEFYVSGNEHFIPFSRDSAFNLIKAEILGFICSHKKLLKSGVYDMPRNGCENLYPVVSDADH